MQRPPPMVPLSPQANITTQQIQQRLDENKRLIVAIMENQHLGKLAECAHYQAQLQSNLMHLAAIADAQPPSPMMPPQMSPHPGMHLGGYYMQHPQAAAMSQQPGMFPPRMPLHVMQEHQQLQAMRAQMGIQNNGVHPIHSEASTGIPATGGPPATSGQSDQDTPEGGASGVDTQGGEATDGGK